MHKYFRAIGYSEPFTKMDRLSLLDDVVKNPTYRAYTTNEDEEDTMLTELRMDFGDGYGISVFGVFDRDNEFECETMLPYFRNRRVSSLDELSVERKIDGHSFAGTIDDLNIGTSLIFHVLNTVDCMKNERAIKGNLSGATVSLSGLSVKGTVVLPIQKSASERQDVQRHNIQRKNLMSKARRGDEDAIKTLNAEEMDTYTVVVNRLQYDDIFTLVDSYVIPTGSECDLYSVLGEIIECRETINPMTLEKIYVMLVDFNSLQIQICINYKDLFGEPAVGRRFRGTIWLQGNVNFPEMTG